MTGISIIGAGMVTAVGFNYESSCAAIRAGIKGLEKQNLWDAANGEYLIGARVNLPQWWEGTGKLADLVAPAIWECLTQAAPERPESIPILLGLSPRDRPYRPKHLEEEIVDEIEWRLGLPRHRESGLVPIGNVAGLVALDQARQLIDSGRARFCVVAGVDSFLQQQVVVSYMQRDRIITKTNSNGFFPGEAGTAVLVTRSGRKENELKVLGIGFGAETATIDSELPFRGTGMTKACKNALAEAKIPMHQIDYRNTDLNGEHYKFKEASFILSRLLRQRVERMEIWHPPECVGEIGAAAVPCVLAMSFYAGIKDFAPGPRSLNHFSGDGPERGACITEFSAGSSEWA